MGRVYTNPNKVILQEMVEIYKPITIDWMSYQITRKNQLTFHHIAKQGFGGATEIANGALLTKRAHRILNIIENRDYLLYEVWNSLFELINAAKQPPCDEYVKEMVLLKRCTQKIVYENEGGA